MDKELIKLAFRLGYAASFEKAAEKNGKKKKSKAPEIIGGGAAVAGGLGLGLPLGRALNMGARMSELAQAAPRAGSAEALRADKLTRLAAKSRVLGSILGTGALVGLPVYGAAKGIQALMNRKNNG